jgi:glycosyltransferase involved in cell wall biosynthesis
MTSVLTPSLTPSLLPPVSSFSPDTPLTAQPSRHVSHRVLHFCGTLERNKDGVTRVLDTIATFNATHNIPSLFVAAVGDKHYTDRAIEVAAVPLPKYDGYKLSITSPLAIEVQLRRRHFTPSVVHLHSPCTLGLAGQVLARKFGVPVVATYHTHFPSYLKYHGAASLEPTVRSYLRYFYNRCDAVIAPSKTLAEELRADGIENVVHLPHGVNTQAFHPTFRSHQWRQRIAGEDAHRKKILLYVGRFVWEKNLQMLVEAGQSLLRERSDVALAIVGTGPAEHELRTLLPEAHFLGFQTGHALSESYASSDIFVFPSDTETFGNVTLEALASGLPAVVANAGGSGDLVQTGVNGFTLAPHDSAAWTSALTSLLDDEDLLQQMHFAAYCTAQAYSWDVVLTELQELYTRAGTAAAARTRTDSTAWFDYDVFRSSLHRARVLARLYGRRLRRFPLIQS